uniref:Fucolectin tachylectin-4 pentraxin-1 domain-containing protein n=1 Tax=Cyprinus carpio TaxID=7962 RepID=A0A8C2DZI0_CYPCA
MFIEDLALKGMAVQSSTHNCGATYSICGAAKAIDGIRYSPSGTPHPEETYTYCSHTSNDLNPWWRLDLVDYYYIYKVAITNRGDGWLEQTTGVEIRIGNSLDNNGNNNPRCAVTSSVPARSTVSFSCGGMEGRYVNMYIPKQAYLVLCEVEVYGTVKKKRQVIRVQVKAAENVDEAELEALVLKKLNQTLSDEDVTLTWRTQPNGKVFQKNKTVWKQSPVCSSLK